MRSRRSNAVRKRGRGLGEAMKCLGFQLVRFPGAGAVYRNEEMEDAVFDVVQTDDETRAPTKMTGQPVAMSIYKLPDFTEPEDIREFRDLGEMFCWWHSMVSRKAGVKKSRKPNPVTPMRMSITREEAAAISPMRLIEVKRSGPVLIEPEGVKLFWDKTFGWMVYGYRSDRADLMHAASRAKRLAGSEQHRMNPEKAIAGQMKPRKWALYVMAFSEGPLIMVKMPECAVMKWKDLARKMHQEILLKHKSSPSQKKYYWQWEGYGDPKRATADPWGQQKALNQKAEEAELAFREGKGLKAFWLYAWNESSGGFNMIREPLVDTPPMRF